MRKTPDFIQGITSPNINASRSVPHQTGQLQFDVFPIAIIVVGLKGRIQFMNKLAEDLLGRPTKDLKWLYRRRK